MKLSEIHKTVIHQLKNIFMLNEEEACFLDENIVCKAVNKSQHCLEEMNDKYYIARCSLKSGGGRIDLYNSVMNCIFLYWLSRELFQENKRKIADKVYYLNKLLNSVELFYEVELPAVWACQHPLGSVMGRASYGDYFYFYQGCTVGGNVRKDGMIVYPVLGNHVKMYSNSKILGNCHIGNHTIISANCYIKDQNIPDGVIVFGQSPNLIFKENCFIN